MQTPFTQETYRDYPALSQSTLNNFVEYTFWWRSTNLLNFLYPAPFEETDAIFIGSIVDKIITEGKQNWTDDFEIVSKRLGKSEKPEILQSMVDKIESIIARFDEIKIWNITLRDFFKSNETQTLLYWEVAGKKFKGKSDLIVRPTKTLIDLKVVGSLAQFEKDFLFKDTPYVNHRYTRQLAIYKHLDGNIDTCQLYVIDHSGKMKIYEVPNDTLDRAFVQVQVDVAELAAAIETNAYITKFPSLEIKNDNSNKEDNFNGF